jgi:hypothetical protein
MDNRVKDNIEKRKERNQRERKEHQDQKIDHSVLKYYPSNWFSWKENNILRCITLYGDNGRSLETAEDQEYVSEEFKIPEDADMPQNGSLQLEKLKLDMKEHHFKRNTYKANTSRMFAYILENCSEESRAIVRQRATNYNDIYENQDSILFIRCTGKDAPLINRNNNNWR